MTEPPAAIKQVLQYCEEFYARDGFVKWADIARALGISRQAVLHRINKARSSGALSEADFERYQSMSARRAAARYKKAANRFNIELTVTPENYAWLRKETELRRLTSADIINGLINRARESYK